VTTLSRISLRAIAAGLILGARPFAIVQACGPDFPNSYLSAPFAEQSQLPTLGLDGELDRLRSPAEIVTAKRMTAALNPDREAAAELAELRGIDRSIVHADRLNPPASLPAEFQLYGKGARAWREQRLDAAKRAWLDLLALPKAQRHYRSTWAAYMLGRGEEVSAPIKAKKDWELTRQLAKEGFADSQHLALGSLGAEARLNLRQGKAAEAVELYWKQYALGEPGAAASIQFALRDVFLLSAAADQKNLTILAADPESRKVVTAWFVARGGPYQSWHREEAERFKWWLTALSRSPELSPAESDRWAWAAYAAGEWAVAQTLADGAPPDAPASEWVRGLLLLRHGKLDDAANHLANAARGFPAEPEQAADKNNGDPDFIEDSPRGQLDGVRGALALRQEQYFEALRIFAAAKHWADAAYVAEKVLSTDELKTYVDLEWSALSQPASGSQSDLRYLLARRLARAGRYQEARKYYPRATVASLDAYTADLRLAYDEAQPKSARATAFWAAAHILKEQGLELIGTELEPDYAISGAEFEYPDLLEAREVWAGVWSRRPVSNEPEASLDPLAPTWQEETRTKRSATPTKRYHYRYKALELAWLAAALSPDDDPSTAEILATAGNWVAKRDPETANLFYKTLAIRCPHTKLGQEALATHWLPKI